MCMELHELRHFELRELYYFVAVAEELHFARAAERVGIQQSPLSKAITAMEQRLGVRLFARDRRRTQLTAVGQVLLNSARRVIAEVDQARLDLLAAAAGRAGRLRIAIVDGFQPRIAGLLRQTYQEDPGIHVQVVQQSLSEQRRLLRAGLIDVGLVSAISDLPLAWNHDCNCAPVLGLGDLGEDIDARPLWRDASSAILARDHSLAGMTEIEWEALNSSPLLIVGDGAAACGSCSTLVQHHVRSRVHHIATVGLLLTLAACGKGVGLLAQALAGTIHRDDVVVRPLLRRRPRITTYLLRRIDDEAPVVARFLERARKLAQS